MRFPWMLILWLACFHAVDSESTNTIGPGPFYHNVNVDHFDGSNPKTWPQAYYINASFWNPGSSAPVFLCVGGEGPPLGPSVVVSSVHCNLAVELLKDTKALLFAVEHRYYGCHNLSACPVPDPAAPGALRYLSSRQALADLVAFHAHATHTYGLTPANKWVSFGGSYPGMLAGWSRIKFPHLVHAAVASSAPVQAQVEMRGYNDLVAQAYEVQDNGVGGSAACRRNIALGHALIGQNLSTAEGRRFLASLFKLPSAEWLENPDNQASFAGNGVAYFPAQGNDPACTQPVCNIRKICEVMTGSDTEVVDLLAKVRQMQAAWSPALLHNDRLRSLHRLFISQPLLQMRNPVWIRGAGPDLWGYQTCTEFGFYQTCDVGSQCFFTQGLQTLKQSLDYCKQAFGIDAMQVANNVHFSNLYYGGLHPSGSRVLYVNGEVDPWRALSITNPPASQMPVLYVPGASHHAWTHPSAPGDQVSVVRARAKIRRQVEQWLVEQ